MKAYKEGNSIRVKENGVTILSYSFKTGRYKGDRNNYEAEVTLKKKRSEVIMSQGPITNGKDLLLIDGGQVSIQKIINKRMPIAGIGYEDIKLSSYFNSWLLEQATEVIGGNKKMEVLHKLTFYKPQHWALDRIFIQKSRQGNGRTYLTYCAGQDAQWELNELRKYLYKL